VMGMLLRSGAAMLGARPSEISITEAVAAYWRVIFANRGS
jgi:hypothetical protein